VLVICYLISCDGRQAIKSEKSNSLTELTAFAICSDVMTINIRPAYHQLTPAQRAFVDAFVSDVELRSVQTNRRLVDVLADTRTDDTPMLSFALVRAAIADRVRELQEQAELNIYRTLKELRAMAYSNIANYLYIDGEGQPTFDLSVATPEQMSAVKSIEITETESKGTKTRKFKFTLHDKVSALDKVMRYQGLLSDDNAHWKNTLDKRQPKLLPAFDTIDEAENEYKKLLNAE
jgi:hypothetical protein